MRIILRIWTIIFLLHLVFWLVFLLLGMDILPNSEVVLYPCLFFHLPGLLLYWAVTGTNIFTMEDSLFMVVTVQVMNFSLMAMTILLGSLPFLFRSPRR